MLCQLRIGLQPFYLSCKTVRLQVFIFLPVEHLVVTTNALLFPPTSTGLTTMDKGARLRYCICQTQPKQILRRQCCLDHNYCFVLPSAALPGGERSSDCVLVHFTLVLIILQSAIGLIITLQSAIGLIIILQSAGVLIITLLQTFLS